MMRALVGILVFTCSLLFSFSFAQENALWPECEGVLIGELACGENIDFDVNQVAGEIETILSKFSSTKRHVITLIATHKYEQLRSDAYETIENSPEMVIKNQQSFRKYFIYKLIAFVAGND